MAVGWLITDFARIHSNWYSSSGVANIVDNLLWPFCLPYRWFACCLYCIVSYTFQYFLCIFKQFFRLIVFQFSSFQVLFVELVKDKRTFVARAHMYILQSNQIWLKYLNDSHKMRIITWSDEWWSLFDLNRMKSHLGF